MEKTDSHTFHNVNKLGLLTRTVSTNIMKLTIKKVNCKIFFLDVAIKTENTSSLYGDL